MASERVQRRIELLLDEADAAISRYDWEAVLNAAQAVLAIAPENGDAATFLAAAERALSDYADTLLQRNKPGDREKAMSLLDESLAISSELGMRPLMERVLSRREILKA